MTVRLPEERHSYLDAVDAGLDRVGRAVEEAFGALTLEALRWRPGPERWSVAHCLAHLTHTNGLYREGLDAAFRGAPPGEAPEPDDELRGSWLGRIFSGLVGPDPAFRVKAPRAFRPPLEAVEGEGVVRAFLQEQAAWRALVARARALPLDDLKVASPGSRIVRFRASEVFAIVLNHEERHLDQARAVLEAPGFPAAP